MQNIFPSALVPLRNAVEKAHLLCQNLRMTYLEQLEKSNECVTLADFGTQVIINRALHNNFPQHTVVSEENSQDFLKITSADQRKFIVSAVSKILGENITQGEFINWLDYGQDNISNKSWVIDPIDGTLEFLKSNQYVIGIGELENSIPIFSFLSSFSTFGKQPIHYFTWEGKSYKYVSNDEIITELRVSDRPISTARPYCNNSDFSNLYKIDFIEADVFSTLNGYISIASGESDVLISSNFANTSVKAWDHVGGITLLQNAGGVVSDIDGSELDFSHRHLLSNNTGVILSNGKFHEELLIKI